ncbi:hypothetical protein MJ561_17905 [Klebsiella pneumoniae]|nr:hypothetical protein MJ561_17905 [Klebsiella pneumoniae]
MRVNHIHTFEQLISRYGQGTAMQTAGGFSGAGLLLERVPAEAAHLPLQDTNDRYFANIQKDGS